MATYVTSDVHGYLRALDAALELVGLGSDDVLYVMGDMVDRGPDPIGVVKLVRSLPNARVLMGNHERMLLDVLAADDDRELLLWQMNGGSTTSRELDALSGEEAGELIEWNHERMLLDVLAADDDRELLLWQMNGGSTTSRELDALSGEEAGELIEWLSGLPLFDVVEVADERVRRSHPGDPELAAATRAHLLVHAGIDAAVARANLRAAGVPVDAAGGARDASVAQLASMLSQQVSDDLLWIRGDFWSEATGLIGRDGRGPVVVSGHTPSLYLGRYGRLMSGTGVTEDLQGCVVEVGACRDTGGEADRICIDCAAATGSPTGRVGIMRLEDRATWYVPVGEGA